MALTSPVCISRLLTARAFHSMAMAQPERFKALEAVGFKVDPFGDIQYNLFERLGGHYIDVGTSEKIAKGLVSCETT
jgi:hypothetical protein